MPRHRNDPVVVEAKIRRVQSDLKEPKDGTSRRVTSVVLIVEDLEPEQETALAMLQGKALVQVSLALVQLETQAAS